MLPEHGDEDEDGGDEDEGKGDLRDWSRWERLDIDVRTCALVSLLMPAREGGEEDEGEEGEDNGNDEQVGEYDSILEGSRNPDQVQWILVDGQIVDERSCVVGANVTTAVTVDADAEVANTHAELSVTDDVGDGLCNAGVDLFR